MGCFLIMIVRKQFNKHHVVFLWWFRDDDLTTARWFYQERCGVDDLVVTKSFPRDGNEKTIWQLPSHFLTMVLRLLIATRLFFQEGCGIDDLVTTKLFPHMVVRKQYGIHHVIFSWWFQNDNLMTLSHFHGKVMGLTI